MHSANEFCRQTVGSLNVKSGGTHQYTYSDHCPRTGLQSKYTVAQKERIFSK